MLPLTKRLRTSYRLGFGLEHGIHHLSQHRAGQPGRVPYHKRDKRG